MATVEEVFRQRRRIMGVVNVTPDSFSDGGRYNTRTAAVARALELVAQGADVIDIGGESTRPGAASISADEECERVIPVVEAVSAATSVLISIDTTKAAVASAALAAGASIINDVGLDRSDPELGSLAAAAGAGYIVMHARKTPSDMQHGASYGDVLGEVVEELHLGRDRVLAAGVSEDRLMVDIGLGFAKSSAHNVELLARIAELCEQLPAPVMVGASRKSFLGNMLAEPPHRQGSIPVPHDRDAATIGTTVWAFAHGVAMVRVHEVAGAVAARNVLEEVA